MANSTEALHVEDPCDDRENLHPDRPTYGLVSIVYATNPEVEHYNVLVLGDYQLHSQLQLSLHQHEQQQQLLLQQEEE